MVARAPLPPSNALAPLPFTLRQLQYVVAIADTLSFRRAAEACHVAQPSLSAQLKELEDAIGVRLFERDRRRVIVTRAGAEILLRARRLLLDAKDLQDVAVRVGDPLSGVLRIGIIPTISPYFLPLVAPKLRRKFSRLTFAWSEDKTGSLIEGLEAGRLDAALVALEADLGDVEHEVIATDPFYLVAARGQPLAKKTGPANTDELSGAPVLLLDDGHCFRDQALAVCSAARAQELGFRATSLATLTQMVAAGNGVTLLPALALPTEVRRTDLRVRAFRTPAPHRTIALVWRRGSPTVAALRPVAALMREAFPAPPRLSGSGRRSP